MKPSKPEPTFDWAKLEKAEATLVITRPPGSITLHEYAQRKGLGETSARCTLNRLVADGQMEKVIVKINGHRTSFYTLKA